MMSGWRKDFYVEKVNAAMGISLRKIEINIFFIVKILDF